LGERLYKFNYISFANLAEQKNILGEIVVMSTSLIAFKNEIEKTEKEKAWFALYTKPRNELKAAEQMQKAGINFYLPTVTKLKQWSDRKKKITEPLIRGYIFIFANEKERIISLEQNSIIRCVADNGKAAKIPNWQIENLKKLLQAKTELFIKEGLVAGTKVLIKSGPFEGVVGVIQQNENENTIAVLIDLLNRSIIVHIPKDSEFEKIKD
jgi:transcription antitermination factor NusG